MFIAELYNELRTENLTNHVLIYVFSIFLISIEFYRRGVIHSSMNKRCLRLANVKTSDGQ